MCKGKRESQDEEVAIDHHRHFFVLRSSSKWSSLVLFLLLSLLALLADRFSIRCASVECNIIIGVPLMHVLRPGNVALHICLQQ